MNYKGDMYVLCIQGVSKKAANRMLLYWDQGAPTHRQASTPLATGISTRLGPKFVFWLFLTKNERDHALPSHVHVKIGPTALNFG